MISSRRRALILGGLVAPWLVAPPARAAQQPGVRAFRAGTSPASDGAFETHAAGLDDTGVIVGDLSLSGDVDGGFATRWDDRTFTRLAPLPGDVEATGLDIDADLVVGISTPADGARRAVQWANGEVTALPPLPGDRTGYAAGINARGQIVGASERANYEVSTAVRWENGQVVALPLLPGDTDSQAWQINDAGLVVGQSGSRELARAVRWDNDEPVALGELPRHPSSFARSINNAGQVVGWSIDRDDVLHPVLWVDGEVVALDSPSRQRAIQGQAFDINEAGDVVGYIVADNGARHAALWRDGDLVELGMLPGHSSSTPLAINDAGRIVGWSGTGEGGVARAVRWDNGEIVALPEPVVIVASDPFTFEPTEVTVTPGQVVVVINAGVLEHALVVDEWSIDTGPLGASAQAVLTIPADAGVGTTATFYCSVPGHREGGHMGTFVVAEAAP